MRGWGERATGLRTTNRRRVPKVRDNQIRRTCALPTSRGAARSSDAQWPALCIRWAGRWCMFANVLHGLEGGVDGWHYSQRLVGMFSVVIWSRRCDRGLSRLTPVHRATRRGGCFEGRIRHSGREACRRVRSMQECMCTAQMPRPEAGPSLRTASSCSAGRGRAGSQHQRPQAAAVQHASAWA